MPPIYCIDYCGSIDNDCSLALGSHGGVDSSGFGHPLALGGHDSVDSSGLSHCLALTDVGLKLRLGCVFILSVTIVVSPLSVAVIAFGLIPHNHELALGLGLTSQPHQELHEMVCSAGITVKK